MATQVLAHITGTVSRIEKQQGERVSEGDTVVILESMKMEMPIEAPADGVIAELRVEEGEPVDEGAVVAIIEES